MLDILRFRDYIEIPDNKKSYFYISDNELSTGKLEENPERQRLLGLWARKAKADDKSGQSVDILLIPKIVKDMIPKYTPLRSKIHNQAWEYKRTSFVYIKATINLETLEIKCKRGESIVWADPLIRIRNNQFSAVFRRLIKGLFNQKVEKKLHRFYLNDAPPIICGDDSWVQYILEVNNHFKIRTGKTLFEADTLTDDHGISHDLYDYGFERQTIVMEDNVVFASMHIERLLETLLGGAPRRCDLLDKMISGSLKKKRLYIHQPGKNVDNHLGQMKNDFPLADAQRRALHGFNTLQIGDVLAVSGPPGTGKTTMLQSIVADMVVRRVVKSNCSGIADTAPLILASSSNNKAITNIIDAFGSGEEDTSVIDIHHRWLCYDTESGERFVPMAVYCPSQSVDKKKSKSIL